MALIAIRAFNFATFGRPVAGARIFALGSPGSTLGVTDAAGRAVVELPAGEEPSLVLEKHGFVTTQSGTWTVPAGGLEGPQQEITFQTMPDWVIAVARRWLRVPAIAGRYHLATTVTAAGKTLYDPVQGEPGAVIRIHRDGRPLDVTPIYMGIVPLVHKTNLFMARWHQGTMSSADGGVLIPNLEAGTYTVSAEAPGRRFSVAKAVIRGDSPEFVNLSPPWGPRVLAD